MSITFKRKPLHIGTTIAVSVPIHFIHEGFPTDCEWQVTIQPVTSTNSNDEPKEAIIEEKSEHVEEVRQTPNIL